MLRPAPPLALLALGFVAGCSAPPQQGGGELRVALQGVIGSLEGDGSGWGSLLEDLIFENLLTVDAAGELTSELASRWQRVGRDQLKVWLRPGASFSDGSAATPALVAEALAGTEVKAEVDGDALLLRAAKVGYPIEAAVLFTKVIRRGPNGSVGTGPFVVASREGSRAVLRRRTPAPGRIETVIATSYASQKEAAAHVLRGEADYIAQIEVSSAEFFEGLSTLRFLRASAPSSHTLAIAFGPGRLGREEREALAAALPVDEIRTAALGDGCKRWPRTRTPGPMPAGRPLDVTVLREDPEYGRLGMALRRALGSRGGAVRALDYPALSAAITAGDFDLMIAPILSWPPAVVSATLHSTSPLNWLHYSNQRIDAALEAGEPARVFEALEQDPPVVFLCTPERIDVVTTRVLNPTRGAWSHLGTLPSWELAP